jgi:AraC-like DNA-binding protein
MDLFGEVLLSLKIEAHSIGVFTLGETWGFTVAPLPPTYAFVLTSIDRSFWLMPDGYPPVRIDPGDSVLLLHGQAYAVGSSTDAPRIDLAEHWIAMGLQPFGAGSRWTAPIDLHFGTGDAQGRMLSSAYVLTDSRRSPLLADFPAVVLLRGSAGALLPWLPPLLNFLATRQTATSAGYVATAAHLAELILSSFIRAYALSPDGQTVGWLRGVADARIGKVLQAIHQDVGANWTVEAMARQAGLSRHAFMRLFVRLIGSTPGDYLIAWRIHRAAEMLLSRKVSVGRVAEQVGYQSERAFRAAFTRRYGMPPLRYAKTQVDDLAVRSGLSPR